MQCHLCVHSRKNVMSGHHQKCVHPKANLFVGTILGVMRSNGTDEFVASDEPRVVVSSHGFRNGWATWPIDFDEIWIISCDAYEEPAEPNL